MAIVKVVVLALVLALVSAQPANDLCAGRITITSRTTTNVALSTANNDGVVNTCSSRTEDILGPDVWYQFNAGGNTFAHISSCQFDAPKSSAAFDSVFIVWSGTCAAPLCIANSENNDCGLASSLTFPVTPNTNYIIQVGRGQNIGSSAFSFYFELGTTPFNDVCGNAVDLSTEGSAVYTGSNIGAISDPGITVGETCGGGAFGSSAVWYKFDSHTARMANISTGYLDNFIRSFNTQIFLFEGACNSISSCIAGEDNLFPLGLGETILVNLQKNTTYYIAITGFEGSSGRFAFNLELQVEATYCDTAHHLTLPSGFIPSSTFYADRFTTLFTNAVNPCPGGATTLPIVAAQWYTFNSGSYDRITVDTCSSGADTQLYLTEGVCGVHHFEQGNCVAFADSGCPGNPAGAKLYNIALQQHHIYYVVLSTNVFTDLVVSWVAGAQAQFA